MFVYCYDPLKINEIVQLLTVLYGEGHKETSSIFADR
jgi:hypothetical protein